MESVEHLIVGAGPAGLRAGQVLAEARREVLVAEKRAEIGPKTCAGGLTAKAVAVLRGLGLPMEAGLSRVGRVAFGVGEPVELDPELTHVVTLSRRELGSHQAAWARAAGADVRAGCAVRELDIAGRSAVVGGRRLTWRHLIGADGSDSAVRRALGLPYARACFAAEYNLPGIRLDPLHVECDPALAGGYFWIFPHRHYTSIGAVAEKHAVRPAQLRAYVDGRLARLGLSDHGAPFEGATLEVDFRGLHFPGDVHLAGDAAGVPSSLTAEGIYSALLTGEAVAREIVEPRYRSARVARWLRVKRRHDRFAALLRRRGARAVTLILLARLAAWSAARRPMAQWFLAG
ncbi:MAG TPA: FAD-dependent monooxygenase [Gemmatimonadales bacterium]|nr:FAD-dependent monooxygenase [Gemmatimonadales bacterium]